MRRNNTRVRSRRASTCPPAIGYVGNVFLLGLATLIEELVDLQAANALEVLLEPFRQEQQDDITQDVLTSDVQADTVIDLMDELM